MVQLIVRLVARESPNAVLVERSKDVANLASAKASVRGWVMTTIVGRDLKESDVQSAVMTFAGPRRYFGRKDVKNQIGIVFDRALMQA
jgi:hypothetical protein